MSKKNKPNTQHQTIATPARPNKPVQEASSGGYSSRYFASAAYRNALLGVVAITALVFIPSLGNDFTNWDDPSYVTENLFVTRLSWQNIKAFFLAGIAPGYPDGWVGNYHPLTMLSLAINYAMTGNNASSYHLTNVVLHLCTTAWVFVLTYRIAGGKWQGAALAALLFGIHPMHVESVAWIAERKDVLYGFFFVWALVVYHRYLQQPSTRRLVSVFGLFVLSLLSKPTAVMLPPALLLMDYLHGRAMNRGAWSEKIPFFILSVVFGLITIGIQRDEAVGDLAQFGLFSRFCFVSYGIVMYLVKALVPIQLSALHPYPDWTKGLPVLYLVSPILVLFLVGAVAYTRRYSRMVVFGVALYVLMLLLTLQFVSVGEAIISERYTYTAYIGLFVILGWWLNTHVIADGARWAAQRSTIMGVLAVACVVYGGVAAARCGVWKNSETLWTDVLAKYPHASTAYNNRGNHYIVEKAYDKAAADFGAALQYKPNYYEALTGRGLAYQSLGKTDLSLADAQAAIVLSPNRIQAYALRGSLYAGARNYDAAVADYLKVLQIDPYHVKTYANLGSAYTQKRDFPKAFEYFDKAIQLNRDYAFAYYGRAVAFMNSQQTEKAIADFSTYLQLQPDSPQALLWRAMQWQALNNHQNALQDLNRAIQLAPNRADLYEARAKTYDALGNAPAAAQDRAKMGG
jgi:tetratricopeptide (TPR) repeat protein